MSMGIIMLPPVMILRSKVARSGRRLGIARSNADYDVLLIEVISCRLTTLLPYLEMLSAPVL